MRAPVRRSLFAAGLVCLVQTLACESPIKTEFDADPQVDMTAYRTYAWISKEPLLEPTEGRILLDGLDLRFWRPHGRLHYEVA